MENKASIFEEATHKATGNLHRSRNMIAYTSSLLAPLRHAQKQTCTHHPSCHIRSHSYGVSSTRAHFDACIVSENPKRRAFTFSGLYSSSVSAHQDQSIITSKAWYIVFSGVCVCVRMLVVLLPSSKRWHLKQMAKWGCKWAPAWSFASSSKPGLSNGVLRLLCKLVHACVQ